ncbi:hypothetical protein [Agrobacterium sp. RAC06]|uniref:hypothetical protein n=1 Tax=Agrobacterium sp. RAC06 TaxID=1842536 RepID=UPI00123766ED|nr:hypothetical protein [Agrobacterium sp. RAC06]
MSIEEKSQDQLRYHELMVEAKARLLAINTVTDNLRGIPSQIIREFGILQIRMLCEIIGLACLVAHGDLIDQVPGNLRKEYKPGQIFDALGNLHDDFFPVPGTLKKTEIGWHLDHWEGGPFATKEELATIWAGSGDFLHRGSLKNLIKAKCNGPINLRTRSPT